MGAHDVPPFEHSGEGRENPSVNYERGDVHTFAVTAAGLVIGLATLASVMLMWFLFDHFLSRREPSQPASAPALHQLPPQPRLQRSPSADLESLRHREDQMLHRSQWIDRQRGIASIPIEDAMDLIARRGLPFRSGPRSDVQPPSAAPKTTGFR